MKGKYETQWGQTPTFIQERYFRNAMITLMRMALRNLMQLLMGNKRWRVFWK